MTVLWPILLAAVWAAQPSAEPEFQTIETSVCTFKLCGIQLTTPQQEAIVFGIECIQKTYTDMLGFTFPNDFKVKVILFLRKEDFLRYQQKTIGEIISESGYYNGKLQEAVVWQQEDVQTMVGVLFHESSHMLLRHQIPWCPPWINEGLAEYFEGLNLFNGNRCICLQESRMDRCKNWLKYGFPIEFEPFIALDRESFTAFDDKNKNAGYTIGYSIVYFLMTNTQTQNILKEILWDFKRNAHNADSVATINQIYPGGIKRLELHWKRSIPRARLKKPLKAVVEKTREKECQNDSAESQ